MDNAVEISAGKLTVSVSPSSDAASIWLTRPSSPPSTANGATEGFPKIFISTTSTNTFLWLSLTTTLYPFHKETHRCFHAFWLRTDKDRGGFKRGGTFCFYFKRWRTSPLFAFLTQMQRSTRLITCWYREFFFMMVKLHSLSDLNMLP